MFQKGLKKSLLILILVGMLSVFLYSCSPKKGVQGTKGKGTVKVVASFLPLYDVARQVGGNLVEVRNLLPPGGSPHTFEPTPEDVKAVEEADLVFKLGLHLDDWMDRIVKGAGAEKKLVILSKGVDTIPLSGNREGVDPHIWMDPVRMKKIAQNVYEAYVRVYPEKKEVFKKNYEEYIKKLEELDNLYRTTLSKFKKKDFVTFHPFLNYQAKRYGMNQVAVVTEFAGKEPDPKRIIEVVNILKKKGVKVVFVEPEFSPKASETIAREIGGKVIKIDPIGSIDNPNRNTYIKNMQENLKSLEEAFSLEN